MIYVVTVTATSYWVMEDNFLWGKYMRKDDAKQMARRLRRETGKAIRYRTEKVAS